MTYEWDHDVDVYSYAVTILYTSDDGVDRSWSGHVRFDSPMIEARFLTTYRNNDTVDITGYITPDGAIVIDYLV